MERNGLKKRSSGDSSYFNQDINSIDFFAENLDPSFFHDLLFSILPNLREAVIIVDYDFRVVFMNKTAEELIQSPLQVIKGKTIRDYLAIYDSKTLQDILAPKIKDEVRVRQGKLTFNDAVLTTKSSLKKKISLSVLALAGSNHHGHGLLLLINEKRQDDRIKKSQLERSIIAKESYSLVEIIEEFNHLMEKIREELNFLRNCCPANNEDPDELIRQMERARLLCIEAYRVIYHL